MLMPSLPVATNGLVDMEALHSRSCRHFCLSKYPLYRVGWAHRIPLDLMRPLSRWLMMPGAIQSTMSYSSMAGLMVAVEQLLSLGEARIEAHARTLAAMLASDASK